MSTQIGTAICEIVAVDREGIAVRGRSSLAGRRAPSLLALPASALADVATGQDKANGARDCAALRTSLGTAAFGQTYGTTSDRSNAYGKCVAKWTQVEHQQRRAASTACTSEREDAGFTAAHGGKTFAQFYGSGKNGANAFGRCVSQKSKAKVQEERAEVSNAARKCKAELKSLGATAFKAKYGTNASKFNAFGKCVSKLTTA